MRPLSSPRAHFPASLCLRLLPVLSRSQGRADELLFKAVTTSARYLACSAQAGLGQEEGDAQEYQGFLWGLTYGWIFVFIFFSYYRTKKKLLRNILSIQKAI